MAEAREGTRVGETTEVKYITGQGTLPCQRCGSYRDVVSVELVYESLGKAVDATMVSVRLCASCLAQAIDQATGFKTERQLDSWRYVRETHKKNKEQKGAGK